MELYFAPEMTHGQDYLDSEQSRHCFQVMRHRPGDKIGLVDGRGNQFIGRLTECKKTACIFEVEQRDFKPDPLGDLISIAIAPTKNLKRFEWFLEKATEIGISEIQPLICARSERRKWRNDRLLRILISAMKQSGRSWLPLLKDPMSFGDFLSSPANKQRYIAHCTTADKVDLQSVLKKGSSSCVMIGPEGDFSAAEIEAAVKFGATGVSLGSSRLRTETAALVALMTLHLNHFS